MATDGAYTSSRQHPRRAVFSTPHVLAVATSLFRAAGQMVRTNSPTEASSYRMIFLGRGVEAKRNVA